MRPRSPKRAAQERIYAKRRLVFLEAHPRCGFPGGCVSASSEVHHRKGRVGALLLDESHWSALCNPHHSWVTVHPAESIAMGISEKRVGVAS